MFFILFVLNDMSLCDELLYAWEDAGVKGVTILAGTGLGRIRQNLALQEDFPIFPSLTNISDFSENLSRTLFTIVENQETVDQLLKNTEKVVGSLQKPNTGILIVLPAVNVYGLKSSHMEE